VAALLPHVALQVVFGTDAQGQTLAVWTSLAIGVVFAFEANDLRASSLERKGYRLAGVASGRDRTEAERSFFTTWLPQQVRPARAPERGQEPRREAGTTAHVPRVEGEEVIGLFPRP
jgi:hypothetical protein